MVFSSTVFLFLFLPLVFAFYYIGRSRQYRNIILLVFSIFFYAWGEPLFIFLMLLSILVTWLLGLGLARAPAKRIWLILGVVWHIGILFVFKYLSFLSRELGSGRIDITLPIGISFFTFQMMSYLFDVWYGNARVQRNLLSLALYVSLFPQLIAGPIVRYSTVEDEIMNRRECAEDFQAGIRRFVLGLGKKALIADFLAVTADNIYGLAHLGHIPAMTAWLGAIAYMLQIYYDFSGYSDMAIGLGQCFGFHFMENFRDPYLTRSVSEFWRRWHISLSSWFRDYVYIPLGGNRVPVRRHIFNLFIIWTLTGIWHGANWTFMVWGLIYAVILIMEKYVCDPMKWPKAFGHLYTLVVVCLCWVFFRSTSLGDAMRYLSDLFGTGGLADSQSIWYWKNSVVVLIIALVCCAPFGKLQLTGKGLVIQECLTGILLVFILVITAIFSISGGYSPFIYFNF